jgi:hypothetical protein
MCYRYRYVVLLVSLDYWALGCIAGSIYIPVRYTGIVYDIPYNWVENPDR